MATGAAEEVSPSTGCRSISVTLADCARIAPAEARIPEKAIRQNFRKLFISALRRALDEADPTKRFNWQLELIVRNAIGGTAPTDRCAMKLSGVHDWRQISIVRIGYLLCKPGRKDTASIGWEGEVGMQENSRRKLLRLAIALATLAVL